MANERLPLAVREDRAERAVHARRYIVSWALLLALTILTFGAAKLHLGRWNVPVALCIATVKATVVALYFMHLREQGGANRLVLLTSVLFVVLLMAGVLADVSLRFPLAVPTDVVFPGEPARTDRLIPAGAREPWR
jgi:cytochrome c oxidase subunit 4